MAAKAPSRGKNEPPPAPIIVKKITVVAAGHHGGAWKVAYADFVTAMMAFFLLMWLLGATNTSQRKSIADYFKPTALTKSAITVNNTSGSIGVMGGQQIASVGKIIQVQTSFLQFPLAAANAVILLLVVLMIIWALTRLVDIRKEL